MESVRIYLISVVSISTSVYDRYSKILVARFKETSSYGIRNHSRHCQFLSSQEVINTILLNRNFTNFSLESLHMTSDP